MQSDDIAVRTRAKEELYANLERDLREVLDEETDPIAFMSTLTCLLREKLGFFWVGFYRVVGGELVIGPYQGTLGCLRIDFGRGVCGFAATTGKTVVVRDVHEFPGHIACDSRSNSEIVVPVFDDEGSLRAVLDIDSTEFAAFDEVDARCLESVVSLMRSLKWESRN